MGRATVSPVDTSPCPVLSATISRLFPPRDHLGICSRQDFGRAGMDDNRNATNAPDTVTASVVFQLRNYTPYFLSDPHRIVPTVNETT